MNIEYVGRDAIVQADKVAYTYQVTETPRELDQDRRAESLNWNVSSNVMGDYIVHPYGSNNDLPEVIRDVVANNSLAPGILNKKTELLWGSGPRLYTESYNEKNQLVREWLDDDDVKAWLETWDYEGYLLQGCVDYNHIQGMYTKFVQSKAGRLGKHTIHSLENVGANEARLATHKTSTSKKPTHVIVNEWLAAAGVIMPAKVYPVFNFLKPFAAPISVLYSNMRSFCVDYYTIPSLYGSLEWLRNSTAVPLILKAMSKNILGLRFHVRSPQAYWDAKEDELKADCERRGVEYKKSMLQELEAATLKTIGDVLSGIENTGKFLHTKIIIEADGTNIIEHGWEIIVIDQKIKEFVEAQVSIANRADRAISAGIGLHGALGNIADQGKSDSGSEQIYAFKNYMASGVNIPEMIVMKAMNYALKANFPGKGIKMGFYHEVPEKEQDVNPENRIKNAA